MSDLVAPKGTFDVLPPDSARFLAVRETLTAPLRRAGYGYVETPVFEDTAVFARAGSATLRPLFRAVLPSGRPTDRQPSVAFVLSLVTAVPP